MNALESIDQLHPGDWSAIEDFIARKRANDQIAVDCASTRVAFMEDVQAGCTGSRPLASPRARDHVGEVETTWIYEDDFIPQMLDQQWIEILNKIKPGSTRTKFTLTRKLTEGSSAAAEYVVDIDAMTSTNKGSKTVRFLHRMEFRVLGVRDMLVAEAAATVNEFINNGWAVQWQVEDFCGWKNVSEAWNGRLVKDVCDPNKGVLKSLIVYDMLRSQFRHHATRILPLRMVALKEVCKS